MDKRAILVPDASERAQVEKCLDTIQRNIKVTGLRSMIERLETITRQLGLKFTAGPTGKDTSLYCLESDLSTLARLQSYVSEPVNIIHKTPVGVLEPRKGGHAMKLTFFVSPYELIDRSSKTALPLNIETVTSRNLGYSANVCIESSNRCHKLQTAQLMRLGIASKTEIESALRATGWDLESAASRLLDVGK